ncbi:MAG: hypothetical protein ACE5HS_04945 [bacterium]
MRIGEIAIVGPGKESKQEFIEAVCDEIDVITDNLIFGRLQINDQLVIHLYGLELTDRELNPSWDLVSKKLLGYVVLFNWNESESYSDVKATIDSLVSRYKIPFVVAGILQNKQKMVPDKFMHVELNLAEHVQLTFCKVSDPKSVRQVLIMLINSVIDKIN